MRVTPVGTADNRGDLFLMSRRADQDGACRKNRIAGADHMRISPESVSRHLTLLAFFVCLGVAATQAQDAKVLMKFRVKYVSAGAVYLEGGRDAGLSEGQRLTVGRSGPDESGNEVKGTAEVRIVSVASASAVAEILSSDLEIRPGDTATLSTEDAQKLTLLHAAKDARKYPQVITFTEGDPLDEEVREYIPRPPSPEVNRIRGRIGVEYNSIKEPGSSAGGLDSSQIGFVMRADMSRIGGSYWGLSGYYRGRFNSQTNTGQETINDLLNRTYHLVLSYNNPDSHWVAGFGRFYLPWASSLDTIDGGYVGRHHGKFTYGLFAGSAPDPTSWNYAPNRQIGGGFFSLEDGSYDSFRYTTTVGLAVSRVDWHPDRQFLFMENGVFYKRYLSIYHVLQSDLLLGNSPVSPAPAPTVDTTSPHTGPVLSRDFLTVRIQPYKIVSFDVSENYFRNIPTFDTRLISTGLLDNLLFQGLSGGVRLELPYRITPYVSIGKSHTTGDEKNSWNEMYGLTCGNIWHTGLRADFRYSKFDSSFGSGIYRTLMLSRQLGESLRFDLQVGQQSLTSSFTAVNRVRWVTSNVDYLLGRHYFLGGGFSIYRGGVQSYNQLFFNLGYRF
jgi:hypothetical protein